jgi:hypothetical protein
MRDGNFKIGLLGCTGSGGPAIWAGLNCEVQQENKETPVALRCAPETFYKWGLRKKRRVNGV